MTILLRMGDSILRAIKILLSLAIFFFLFGYLKNYIPEIKQYPYLEKLAHQEQSVTHYLRNSIQPFIPTTIMTIDITRPLSILFLIFLSSILGSTREKIRSLIYQRKHQQAYKETTDKLKKISRGDVIDQLEHKLHALERSKKKDRKQLVKEFITLKKEIDSMGRHLAFLSIDVVDSTLIKKGGDPIDIAYDFDHYNTALKQVLERCHCLKFSSNPDGTMACFTDVDAAVFCGQEILRELIHFNAEIKHTKMDFKVRIGINSGVIIYDAEEPLAHAVDRVIDIAAHMQKHAEPNTIFIAKHAIEPLIHREGFNQTDKTVDEVQVYSWKPP